MKKILTYGTFDLLHKGHINILKKCREMGDYLIVGVSTDEFNIEKKKTSLYVYKDRKYILESIKYVDLVIPENNWAQKKDDVIRYEIDTFVMGDDWAGKFDFLKDYCEVVYLPRTENISTTLVKENIIFEHINKNL